MLQLNLRSNYSICNKKKPADFPAFFVDSFKNFILQRADKDALILTVRR